MKVIRAWWMANVFACYEISKKQKFPRLLSKSMFDASLPFMEHKWLLFQLSFLCNRNDCTYLHWPGIVIQYTHQRNGTKAKQNQLFLVLHTILLKLTKYETINRKIKATSVVMKMIQLNEQAQPTSIRARLLISLSYHINVSRRSLLLSQQQNGSFFSVEIKVIVGFQKLDDFSH